MIEILPSVGILDARTRLAELCGEVARSGQPVRLSRLGTPIVELRPLQDPTRGSSDALSSLKPGVLELWRDCRRRFGPVHDVCLPADWIEPTGGTAQR
jgi:antitoxin (DNA-binding transcriptional repressor) of toxin-antitoxin stability system